jgi:uncharacterized protein DUF6627
MLKIRQLIASLLIVCMALPLPSYAGMLATDAALSLQQRDRVMNLLQRADVRQRLEAYGVSPADVQARVASLSDQEVAQLAGDIDRLPAGGVDIIGAIILVFIVLLITDILGYTKVFPFTRSNR